MHEHTHCDRINLTANLNVIRVMNADRPSHFVGVCAQHNQVGVLCQGPPRLTIDQCNVEHANPGNIDSGQEWMWTTGEVYNLEGL